MFGFDADSMHRCNMTRLLAARNDVIPAAIILQGNFQFLVQLLVSELDSSGRLRDKLSWALCMRLSCLSTYVSSSPADIIPIF